MTRRALNCILLPALLMLGGCSLLAGGGGKADLYRFGDSPLPTLAEIPPGAPAAYVLAYEGAKFDRGSRGDRILTSNGVSTNYIAKARWIAPAEELFDGALLRKLAAVPYIHLTRLGVGQLPDYILVVDMQRFEAVYSAGAQSPPDVVLEAWVTLLRRKDRAIVGQWPLTVTEHAGDNRVTYIVQAFDRATATLAARITELTSQTMRAS